MLWKEEPTEDNCTHVRVNFIKRSIVWTRGSATTLVFQHCQARLPVRQGLPLHSSLQLRVSSGRSKPSQGLASCLRFEKQREWKSRREFCRISFNFYLFFIILDCISTWGRRPCHCIIRSYSCSSTKVNYNTSVEAKTVRSLLFTSPLRNDTLIRPLFGR